MATIKDLQDLAIQSLIDLGYVVDSQSWITSKKGRLNVFGWGPNNKGELVPLIAAEIVEDIETQTISDALQQLNSVHLMLGTHSQYLFDGSNWWKVATDFKSIEKGALPPRINQSQNAVSEVDQVETLIKNEFWDAINKARGTSESGHMLLKALDTLIANSNSTSAGIVLKGNPGLPMSPNSFVKALHRILLKRSGKDSQFATPDSVGEFLFNLTSGLVLPANFYDPFAGSGWNCREAIIRYSASLTASIGRELNLEIAELAEKLGKISGLQTVVENTNSFTAPPLKVDLVVSAPPMGMRLSEAIETPFGSTRNGDVAAIAHIASSLNVNGVAAVITAPSWTWNKEAAPMRAWLSTEFHVVALLSLPPVLGSITAISPVVMILKRSKPGQTIVGTLKEDWFEQSTDTGALKREISKLVEIEANE